MDAHQSNQATLMKAALQKLEAMEAELKSLRQVKNEPIAIIGMGCRFPGECNTPADFWGLLDEGRHGIIPVPPSRWDSQKYYSPNPDEPGKLYIREGGFVEPLDMFDPSFFEISPREAAALDPQQRLLLEASWAALEDANLVPESLYGSQTSVYVGISTFDYNNGMVADLDANAVDLYFSTGNSHSIAAGRLSYFLRLNGPCMVVDTACSSSLVALHQACQSLRLGESNLALVGGVNTVTYPELMVALTKARMLSPDCRCKTFDAAANGYARSEGAGMVVLKRLADAQADGDTVLAVVRGSAVNQDGPSSGLTVPSGLAQEAVIRQALANAGVKATEVSYVEAHGTGTFLGDPIEANALAELFGPGRPESEPLYVGSAKTNMGHLEAAAGVVGLMKIILAMKHERIPKHLNLVNFNPHINWDDVALRVPTEAVPWPATGRRLAGISGFGFSGTNAHVILQEPPAVTAKAIPAEARPLQLLTLSAKSAGSLGLLAAKYQSFLEGREDFAEVCRSAALNRSHFNHRLNLVAASAAEAQAQLAAYLDEQVSADWIAGHVVSTPRVALLFTGQGAQYVNMGRGLYETEPRFRATIDECAAILADELDRPLLSLLYPESDSTAAAELVNQTAYTQPLLFAIEYALADLWQSWGLVPKVVLGHSVGEYVAACVAGVFSLADGLRLIAARGRLMGALPAGGQMVAVLADEATVRAAIVPDAGRVSIGSLNGPTNVVISGYGDAIAPIVAQLVGDGVKVRQLDVSHGFHSPQMDAILDEFESIAAQVTFHAPRIPVVSNLTGQMATEAITQPRYWRDHIRQPVQFARGIAALQQLGTDIFLEVGPQPTLLGMARYCLPADSAIRMIPSLRRGHEDDRVLLRAVAALDAGGASIDWSAFHGIANGSRPTPVTLPTYPFQRIPYWYHNRDKQNESSAEEAHPLLGRKLRLAGSRALHFERKVSADEPAFLGDHTIFDTAIFPGTGYLELALAAGRELFETDTLTLTDVKIEQMLRLDGEAKTVQIVLTSDADGGSAGFEIYSALGETDWQRHAHGRVQPSTAAGAPTPRMPPKGEPLPIADTFYPQIRLRGLTYGPDFQGVAGLWATTDGVLGRVELPANLTATPFLLHPALSDACLQVLAGADPRLSLPVGLKRLTVHQRSAARVWCHAEPPAADAANQQESNLTLFADDGSLVAELAGFQVEPLKPSLLLRLLQGDVRQWLYEPTWQAAESTATPMIPDGRWLVFTDSPALPTAEAWPVATIRVTPGARFNELAPNHLEIDPAAPADFERLLHAQPTLRGVVYAWGSTAAAAAAATGVDTDQNPVALQPQVCGGALHLVQALGKLSEPPRLWIATVGAQAVSPEEPPVCLATAPLWGLGRVIAMEYPALRTVRLDLDPRAPVNLLAAILATDDEDQVAYRGGARYVSRLQQHGERHAKLRRPSGPYRVQLPDDGILDHMTIIPVPRQAPGPGEVEVEVVATGLNFRDVLTALGMLNDYLADGKKPEELKPGNECSGVVVSVGAGVTNAAVGDEVVCVAPGSLGQYVVVGANHYFRKPKGLSHEQASTLPIVYLSVYYGLNRLVKMRRGDRILIHAAAGGVGQAAVQMAKSVGAEIFATASPEKWDFLRAQGIKHVMHSRTLDFSAEVLALTGGEGVDIVLNSLNGEFITKSLAALRKGGRFLELGKIGILDPDEMAAQRPDVAYSFFDLTTLYEEKIELMAEMFDELTGMLESGELEPMPIRTYALEQTIDAYRFMAQARHIGKVVITMAEPKSEAEDLLIRADGTYLITGGLGALGRQTATWLAQNGATSLVLTGRRGADPDDETLRLLRNLGATPHVVQADVAVEADVSRLMAMLEMLPPLRGVFHAAGVLADGVLKDQTWAGFARVMGPKVAGAWNLHQATRGMELDYFVGFSSVASLWGSPGQGNYAAANAFIDGLAHHRRAAGLPGLSLNWGGWAEVGMAASLGQDARFEAMGVPLINPLAGLDAMRIAMSQSSLAQVGVVDVNWEKFGSQSRGIPFFTAFAGENAGGKGRGHLLAELSALPPGERKAALQMHLQVELARILSLPSPQDVEPHHRFANMGLDSLMGVEFNNSLETGLGVQLAATMIFNYPTVDKLTDFLLATAFKDKAPAAGGEALDLHAESRLPADIQPSGPAAASPPRAILLTGATGFLGAHLLADLLRETEADIYCLVRGSDAAYALDRVRQNLLAFEVWDESQASRVVAVVGDLSRERFGLSPEAFDALASQVDLIYHNAASVDLIRPYDALYSVNVLGTQEVLRLAATGATKPVHHVSTIAQFLTDDFANVEAIMEQDIPRAESLTNGYAQTKWVAEQFITQARERGIPAAVYRVGLITGHSVTGHTNLSDISARMVQGCSQLGATPSTTKASNFVPVDFASRSITHLSRQPESLGQTYHIVNTETARFSDIAQWATIIGYSLETLPYVEWRAKLVGALDAGADNALRPMMPMFGEKEMAFDIDQHFDCKNTLTALAGTGIKCPPVLELFGTYLPYMIKHGVIDPPPDYTPTDS